MSKSATLIGIRHAAFIFQQGMDSNSHRTEHELSKKSGGQSPALLPFGNYIKNQYFIPAIEPNLDKPEPKKDKHEYVIWISETLIKIFCQKIHEFHLLGTNK